MNHERKVYMRVCDCVFAVILSLFIFMQILQNLFINFRNCFWLILIIEQ